MDGAPQLEGGVRETHRPESDSVDRTGRSASECQVSEVTVDSIAARICRLAPEFAGHFDQALAEYETPHFVIYGPGDFYRSHRDIYPDVVVPKPLARRRVSVVIFLNDGLDSNTEDELAPAGGTERYGGGVLRLCSHETILPLARRGPCRRGEGSWWRFAPTTGTR